MLVLASRSLRFCRPGVRSFFASSTDHTRLLKEAEIHCISQDNGVKQYVLVAEGMDIDTVAKVPQLHLARIYLDGSANIPKIYGAKVVNRTLGDCSQVCARLLDAALTDAGPDAQAWSTLHGLSEWVLQQGNDVDAFTGLDEAKLQAVQAIAKNESDTSNELWESVAMEFVNKGLGDEAKLYGEKGSLDRIEHKADTSEFANTCGGSMAVFRLS